MLYRRWEGPTTPTFIPQSRPDQSTCIDHIAIWDPKSLTTQNGPTQTIKISFLYHNGVLGTASLPLLVPPAFEPSKPAITPRVPTFKYPIPSHSLEEWKARVAVDSHSPTTLAIANANAILRQMEDDMIIASPETTG
jgi:hypothetical protein